MAGTIRLATVDDSDEILGIYAPYVRDTIASLELEPPGPEEFRRRVAAIGAEYPYLVHVVDGRITGFAYASRHMERDGYRYNVTTSIYLSPDCRGKGVGTTLYSRLLALTEAQGVRNAYAVISLPNPGSLRLHARFGFTEVGTFRRTGYKFERWHDVVWLEKRLGDEAAAPRFLKISELPRDRIEQVVCG